MKSSYRLGTVNDSYTIINEGGILSVAAPGILSNDSDPDEDPLEAVLVIDVSDGTLALDTDGSFSYTPRPNFNGSDAFYYMGTDGARQPLP